MNIGKEIKAKRKLLYYSQEELAAKMGVKRSLVSKWENNKIIPNILQMEALQKILGIKVFTKEFMEKTGGND